MHTHTTRTQSSSYSLRERLDCRNALSLVKDAEKRSLHGVTELFESFIDVSCTPHTPTPPARSRRSLTPPTRFRT